MKRRFWISAEADRMGEGRGQGQTITAPHGCYQDGQWWSLFEWS